MAAFALRQRCGVNGCMRIKDLNCETFIDDLSSKKPVPGGGGAAALCAALGVALGTMVGNITLERNNPGNVQNELIALNEKACLLQSEMLDMVDADGDVFMSVMRAYRMPKETPEDKSKRLDAIEKTLTLAATVPIRLMEKICEAIDLHVDYGQIGSNAVISDVGVGVLLCKAALQSASLNVLINTKSMKDRLKADTIEKEMNRMLMQYTPLADSIHSEVLKKLRRDG